MRNLSQNREITVYLRLNCLRKIQLIIYLKIFEKIIADVKRFFYLWRQIK